MLHAASWISFFFFFCPEFVLFHACHYFSIGVKNFPPRQHVPLPWTSIAGTCTTWQWIASSTMRDSTKHDFCAHIVDLFQKKKQKRGERKSSRLPKVKWIGFKDSWAVRKLRNYLYMSTPELYMQTRSKCVHHTLYQIGYTLDIPENFLITFMNVINLAFVRI